MKNILPQRPKSSSSKATVKSVRSSDILELGEKIVEELNDDRSSDILSRWMAHSIAEKIKAAELAQGAERAKATSDCADLILRLWAHRHQLPNGIRPFESFEPIFRTLESLDAPASRFRYFGFPFDRDQVDEPTPVQKWIQLTEEIDETAREIIKYCLTNAAEAAVTGKERWAEVASKVATADDFDVTVVLRLVDASGQLKDDLKDAVWAEANGRIARLEKLVSVSQEMIAVLRKNARKPAKAPRTTKQSRKRAAAQGQ